MSRRIPVAAVMGGLNRTDRLIQLFGNAGGQVGLLRRSSSYYLSQSLGSDRFLTYRLTHTGTHEIGSEFLRIYSVYISKLYAAYNDDDANVTVSGFWETSESDGTTGGRIRWIKVAGRYIETVVPVGTTTVKWQTGIGDTNHGIALITIDGDNTLATGCQTAQQLVDASILAASALVGGGGTLNPTDRVVDTNGLSTVWDRPTLVSDLDPSTTHTVRITVTGYRAATATDNYIWYGALLCYGTGTFDLSEPLYYLEEVTALTITTPVWEISWSMLPTGATNYEWLGHTGSLKFKVLPTASVDGGAYASVAYETPLYGPRISLKLQLSARHTEVDAGATEIAVCDFEYLMRSYEGLDIIHSTTWSLAGLAYGYPCMMTTNETMDRAKAFDTAIFDMSGLDADTGASTSGRVIWCWDADGTYGMLMNIPDLSVVDNWENNTGANDLYFYNPGGANLWNKAYATRFNEATAFSISDVWLGRCNYRVKWFISANGVLSII